VSKVLFNEKKEETMKLRTVIGLAAASAALIMSISLAQAAEGLKPFVLGTEPQKADPAQVADDVKTALQGQSFEGVGA
jgi:ABC-type oligopeptide transport system substrate-binding subunit